MKHYSRWWIGVVVCVAFGASMSSSVVSAVNRHALVVGNGADADFVALREAALRGETAESNRLANRLGSYPIQSYVEYYRLYPRLQSTPEGEIRQFLERYDGTAIADRLRNDWLLLLGRAHDWRVFDEQYPHFALNDDTQVKCYALQSRMSKGENITKAARDLLQQPKYYGDACVELIGKLAQEKKFNESDVWRQVRLAVESGVSGTARRVANYTDVNDKQLAQAIDKPFAILERGAAGGRAARELFLIALGRAGRDKLDKAVHQLEKAQSKLNADENAIAWSQLALQASLALDKDAVTYWRRSFDAPLSIEGYQWRVRTALRVLDWPLVARSIDAMPPELQKDPAWLYWRGRAHAALGRGEEAKLYFHQLVGQHHFYGLLSAEELSQPILAPAKPAPPTAAELAEASANTGLINALKFYELELRFEGNREWNWQLRKMNDRQLLAAGEFARRSDALDRMVASADRAKVELDLVQRYPTPHEDIMQAATAGIGLDRAWVYGLIRQESRFVKTARSVVGASGLMQIMPRTATYVAKKIGMSGFTLTGLNDTRTNITLGTQYLNMVLSNLGGSQTLATAAYNAGPGRPRQWRATLEKPVEGAIFAESIPFSETRGYVKNVLANATWYSLHFDSHAPSLKTRLGTISPRDANLIELGDLP
jgi:soluble lytic murein transglycosylase